MSLGIKGWHPGEAALQTQLQYSKAVADAYELYSNSLPDEQRNMYSQVVFLPVVTLDPHGRPWVSVLASSTGGPGVISSPEETVLMVKFQPWQGDPINITCLSNEQKNAPKSLVAGTTLSTNLETLKGPRTKFSGVIDELHKNGSEWLLKLEVKQALPGSNSRFMATRQLIPYPHASPNVAFEQLELKPSQRLPREIIDFITTTDALYFGTYYAAAKKDEKDFPSHLGFNIRSGIPGFARVRTSDGRTIVFPDYPGNHLMNSLGNVETTPVAAITIPSYETGDILYLTGTARNHVGKRARMLLPRVQVLTAIKITGYIFVKNAIPLRERQGLTQFSPVCPPLRVLTEERSIQKTHRSLSACLVSASLKAPDLGVFRFKTSSPISIGSGEWVHMDFSAALQQDGKLSQIEPKSEDFLRAWTVTSFSSSSTDEIELTIRKRPNGLVTGYLFDLAENLNAITRTVAIPIVTSGGDFTFPADKTKLFWIAGGIGVTPFISLFKRVLSSTKLHYDIVFVYCTSTPETYLPLFLQALEKLPPLQFSHRLDIHVFSKTAWSTMDKLPPLISLKHHSDRITPESFNEFQDIKSRDISLCAPPGLARVAMQGLLQLGIPPQFIRRETFTWLY